MLFTGQFLDSAFTIYQEYYRQGGKGVTGKAYMTWLAYQDFVLGEKVPKKIYDYIEQGIAWEENLADVCGLAYLKYLSGKPQLTEHQRIRAERMTTEYIQRRQRFGFMKPLLERLGKPQLLEDKTFVEYRTNPAHKVVIHYVVETPREKQCSYVAERLYPTESGVFVKEFTLFYGERLTWFVTEIGKDGEETATPDHSITETREEELLTGTKYAAVYEMARSLEEHNLRLLERQMDDYGRRQFLVERFFSLK